MEQTTLTIEDRKWIPTVLIPAHGKRGHWTLSLKSSTGGMFLHKTFHAQNREEAILRCDEFWNLSPNIWEMKQIGARVRG